MTAITFNPIAGTALYAPPEGGDERMLYLNTGTPSSSPLSLDQTWSSAARGCYLFVSQLPTAPQYAAFQKAVLALLPAAASSPSSFAWVGWDGQNASPFLLLPIGGGNKPVTTAAVVLASPGITPLGIAANTPVGTVIDASGAIQSFVIQYPSQSGSDAPWAPGMVIPMSGDTAGCFCFETLLNDPSVSSGNPVRKQVFDVRFDPVRPFDPNRNCLLPTGVMLSLAKNAAGTFSLSPA